MAFVLADRVQETSTTTGTGSLTLAGAVLDFFTFSSAVGNTNTTNYIIVNPGTGQWEIGTGTVSAGALSRDTVSVSSNSNALVNFSAGTKNVFCGMPATSLSTTGGANKIPMYDASGNMTISGTSTLSGQTSLGGAAGAEALRATTTASAVNRWQVAGATTGSGPQQRATGTDTDVSASFSTLGAGVTDFFSGAFSYRQLRIANATSAVNYGQVVGGATGNGPIISTQGSDTSAYLALISKGTFPIYLQTGGGTQLLVANAASAVNYVQATGAATGAAPYLISNGSDTNVNFDHYSRGTGVLRFYTNSPSPVQQFGIAHTASAVNYPEATGAATGNGSGLAMRGSDTNVYMTLVSKGNQSVYIGTGGGTQFAIAHIASAVNYGQMAGGATGNGITWSAQGTDSVVDINITPKGGGRSVFTGSVVSSGPDLNTSKEVDSTASMTAKTLTKQYTYMTGTAGASMALTLPSAASALDGQIMTVMSTAARASTTWASTGATFVGAPASLTANTPVKFQYHHATAQWFITA